MASPRFLMCVMGAMCFLASSLRTKRTNDFEARLTSYTFNNFMADFGRTYVLGTTEYMQRATLFTASLAQIFAQNAREDQSWTAGVHPFMDLTDDERQQLHGFKPSGVRKFGIAALEMNTTVYGASGDSFEATTPPVVNQGSICGSCWAISATQAVEAQLMKTNNPTRENLYGSPMRLSTQAVLECAQVENPHNCGGPGGCKGATSEVAFDYIRDHGIPLQADHPYHPTHLHKCPLEPYPASWARVTIDGWKSLPSNKAQPLMQAIVEEGAVVVAMDSHNLYPYDSGIFDDCPKDAVVSHALLAKGYGEAGGKKFWSLQNSWGPRWGEGGSVRVLRRDNEDQWCGTDHHPEEGFACDGETQPVTVCGTCGILYDMVIPNGPQVQAPQKSGSDPSSPDMQPDSDHTSAQVANQNHGFSSWMMPPPSKVEVVSAAAEVDGYLSKPAADTSVAGYQVSTTSPLAAPARELPSVPPAIVVPSSTPTEVFASETRDPFTSGVAAQDQPPISFHPLNPPASDKQFVAAPAAVPATPYAPTADPIGPAGREIKNMHDLLEMHGMAPEAVDPPPAVEQVNADDAPQAAQVLPAETKQPAVDMPVGVPIAVKSDSTIAKLWDEIPESVPAADADHAAPGANTPTADDQVGLNFRMPAPTTFADSVSQFNAPSKSSNSVNTATDAGSEASAPVVEVPLPEVPLPEVPGAEFQHSRDVQSSEDLSPAPVEEMGAKVTVLDSNDDGAEVSSMVDAKSPLDSSYTDGMKKIFSQDKFARQAELLDQA